MGDASSQSDNTLRVNFQTLPVSRRNDAECCLFDNNEWTFRDGFRTPRTTSIGPWRSCPAPSRRELTRTGIQLRRPGRPSTPDTCSSHRFAFSMKTAKPGVATFVRRQVQLSIRPMAAIWRPAHQWRDPTSRVRDPPLRSYAGPNNKFPHQPGPDAKDRPIRPDLPPRQTRGSGHHDRPPSPVPPCSTPDRKVLAALLDLTGGDATRR